MALQADKRYVGKVVEGSRLIESSKGTVGFQLFMESEDGPAEYVIWITPKNKERALADFETLGLSEDTLRNPAFLQYELGNSIVGREVQFGTKLEEWRDQSRVKVNWIGKVKAESEDQLAKNVAVMFGATLDDDDIPF